MKYASKILEYQKNIVRLLSIRNHTFKGLETACLCKIGHTACFESYKHALEDLASNGRITKTQTGFAITQ